MIKLSRPGLRRWLSILLLLLSGPLVSATMAEPAVNFGVFPFFPPIRLETQYRELVVELSKNLNTPVQFRTRRSFAAFTRALKQQDFDIALIQPLDYMAIRGATEYIPLVRKQAYLQGVFVTMRKDIPTLSALAGKKIAFPAKQAAVTGLAQEKLLSVGLSPEDYQSNYYEDHSSCLMAITNKSADACVTARIYSEALAGSRESNYSVIDTTVSMAPILIVIGPSLYSQKEKLQAWFLSLNDSPMGRNILVKSYLEFVVPALDEEYSQPITSK